MTCQTCNFRKGGKCNNAKSPRPNKKVPVHACCKHWKVSVNRRNLGFWANELKKIGANVKGTLWKTGLPSRTAGKYVQARIAKLIEEADKDWEETRAEREAAERVAALAKSARREAWKQDILTGRSKKWKKRGVPRHELDERSEVEFQMKHGMTDEELEAYKREDAFFSVLSEMKAKNSKGFGMTSMEDNEMRGGGYSGLDPAEWLAEYRSSQPSQQAKDVNRIITRKANSSRQDNLAYNEDVDKILKKEGIEWEEIVATTKKPPIGTDTKNSTDEEGSSQSEEPT